MHILPCHICVHTYTHTHTLHVSGYRTKHILPVSIIYTLHMSLYRNIHILHVSGYGN